MTSPADARGTRTSGRLVGPDDWRCRMNRDSQPSLENARPSAKEVIRRLGPSTPDLTLSRSGDHSTRTGSWLAESEQVIRGGRPPSLVCWLANRSSPSRSARRAQVSEGWCGRGDSNPYALASASPSSWCVCQFRHFRMEGDERETFDLIKPRTHGQPFSRRSVSPSRRQALSAGGNRCLSSSDRTLAHALGPFLAISRPDMSSLSS
jgi:hypothetical protein